MMNSYAIEVKEGEPCVQCFQKWSCNTSSVCKNVFLLNQRCSLELERT